VQGGGWGQGGEVGFQSAQHQPAAAGADGVQPAQRGEPGGDRLVQVTGRDMRPSQPCGIEHSAARSAGRIGGDTAEYRLRVIEQSVAIPGGDRSQGERALGEVAFQGARPYQVREGGRISSAPGVSSRARASSAAWKPRVFPAAAWAWANRSAASARTATGVDLATPYVALTSSTASRAARPESMPSANRPRLTVHALMQVSR
jgi:hypothetical protein